MYRGATSVPSSLSAGRASRQVNMTISLAFLAPIVGLELETHHPVIEPVSAAEPGTEACDAVTGRQNHR
jgi:hypothetical protein